LTVFGKGGARSEGSWRVGTGVITNNKKSRSRRAHERGGGGKKARTEVACEDKPGTSDLET